MTNTPMETVKLSSTFRIVVPRRARERLNLRPGTRFTVIDKGGMLFLVPQRPMRAYRGIAKGAGCLGLREKRSRSR